MVWNGADLFLLLNSWRKNTQQIIDDATCWVYSLYNINHLENGVIVPVKRSFLVMKNKHFYMNQGEIERFYQKLKIYF